MTRYRDFKVNICAEVTLKTIKLPLLAPPGFPRSKYFCNLFSCVKGFEKTIFKVVSCLNTLEDLQCFEKGTMVLPLDSLEASKCQRLGTACRHLAGDDYICDRRIKVLQNVLDPTSRNNKALNLRPQNKFSDRFVWLFKFARK